MNITDLIELLQSYRAQGVTRVDLRTYDTWSESNRVFPLEENQLLAHDDAITRERHLTIDATST